MAELCTLCCTSTSRLWLISVSCIFSFTWRRGRECMRKTDLGVEFSVLVHLLRLCGLILTEKHDIMKDSARLRSATNLVKLFSLRF